MVLNLMKIEGNVCPYKLLKLYPCIPETIAGTLSVTYLKYLGRLICLFWVLRNRGWACSSHPVRGEFLSNLRFQIHTSTASLLYLLLQIRIKCEILVSQSDG